MSYDASNRRTRRHRATDMGILDGSYRTKLPGVDEPQVAPTYGLMGIDGIHAGDKGDFIRERIKKYCQIVESINEKRLRKQNFPLFTMFEEGLLGASDPSYSRVLKDFELLAFIVGEVSSNTAADRTFMRQDQNLISQAPRELHYAESYRLSPYHSVKNISLRKKFIKGSIKWLEKYFNDTMEEFNAQSLQSSKGLGQANYNEIRTRARGMPFIEKVKHWVHNVLLRHADKCPLELVEGQAFWLILFYLIRAGAYDEALQYSTTLERSPNENDKKFLNFLAEWVNSPTNTLSQKSRSDLLSDFNGRVRDGATGMLSQSQRTSMFAGTSTDPYKYLVYRVLGRIVDDPIIPPALAANLIGGLFGWEDEAWIHLMVVREENPEDFDRSESFYPNLSSSQSRSSYGIRFTLEDCFNRYVQTKTADEWNSDEDPYLYFRILLLFGQFERAISYLWRSPDLFDKIDAMQYALGLAYYGLLLSTESRTVEMDVMVDTYTERPRIDYVKMTEQFVSEILGDSSYPKEAVNYIFFICLFSDEQNVNGHAKIAQKMVTKAVLSSNQIDEFFGQIDESGYGGHKPGYLERFLHLLKLRDWDEMKNNIIKPAAKQAEKIAEHAAQKIEFKQYRQPSENFTNTEAQVSIDPDAESERQTDHAIMLYNLAEDYDTVIELSSKRLSHAMKHRRSAPLVNFVIAFAQGRKEIGMERLFVSQSEEIMKALKSASDIMRSYTERGIIRHVSSQNSNTLRIISSIAEFYVELSNLLVDLIPSSYSRNGEDWPKVLALVDKLNLFPALARDTHMSGGIDLMEASRKSELLKSDYSDQVWSHLPELFLAIEMTILIGWTISRRSRGDEDYLKMEKKSRQLQSFLTYVGRWYMIPRENIELFNDMADVMFTAT